MPPVIAKRKKRRLKCAFTVRRAILSCRAISALSQPWSSSSAICCSRGPSRIELSFIPAPPWFSDSGPIRAVVDRSSMCSKPLAGVRITDVLPRFMISPKIHSMHTAKLTVDFPFRRKMWIFQRVSREVCVTSNPGLGIHASYLLSLA
jgi:hypothetical protein